MSTYTIRFWAGPYTGTRTVNADDSDEAIAKVRHLVRREMSLPMYSDAYRVVDSSPGDDVA